MSQQRHRIARTIAGFNAYITDTDDRQLSTDPATGNAYWKTYNWTAEESKQWTKFRTSSNTLYRKYSNKKSGRTTEVKDNLYLLIKACVRYDNAPVDGHHLLDKVAMNGTTADWVTFNVKKGTALQSTIHTHAEDPGIKAPAIAVGKVGYLFHELLITNPDTPKSKGKPKGIKDIQIYRAVMADDGTQPTERDFQYIGAAKRGRFLSELSESDVRKMAWYKARYLNNRGVAGVFCDTVRKVVI